MLTRRPLTLGLAVLCLAAGALWQALPPSPAEIPNPEPTSVRAEATTGLPPLSRRRGAGLRPRESDGLPRCGERTAGRKADVRFPGEGYLLRDEVHECRAHLVISNRGEVSVELVDGCPTPFADELHKSLPRWRWKPGPSACRKVLRVKFQRNRHRTVGSSYPPPPPPPRHDFDRDATRR